METAAYIALGPIAVTAIAYAVTRVVLARRHSADLDWIRAERLRQAAAAERPQGDKDHPNGQR